MYIHVSLVVTIPGSNELKSKPTQPLLQGAFVHWHSARCDRLPGRSAITEDIRNKISLFCNIQPDAVIPNLNAPILYEVPLMLEDEGLAKVVCRRLNLDVPEPDLSEWTAMVKRAKTCKDSVEIALVGKYVQLHDSYLSVVEALTHGGIENDVNVNIRWVDSEQVTDENAGEHLGGVDGVLVPALWRPGH